MKRIKMTLAALAVTVAFGAWAETDATYQGVQYSTKGDIVIGEWTSQFKKAKEYAEANDLPLLVFWGNRDCPHCKKTEQNMARPEFVAWQKERGLVMSFNINKVTDSSDAQAAFNFTSSAGSSFPFMGVYWKGHVLSGSTREKVCFTAPDKAASWVISRVDALLVEYEARVNSDFGFDESAYNRYEAEAATASVTVTLARKSGTQMLNEQLVVLAPDGKTQKAAYDLSWAVGETNKSVVVAIPANTLKKDGDQLTLQVQDQTDAVKAMTHVTYVVKPASPENPLWDTDRSSNATPLTWGEWTFDLEGAKSLAAAQGGYTLVMVSGSQWCPNCYRFEKNFLELTNELGEVRFEKWARENKIALAVVDVPALKGGAVDKATLLSRTAFPGPDYKDDNGSYDVSALVDRSGLGYLSRKGVDATTAAARQAACIELAGTYTSEGGFLRPEDTEDPSCNGYRPRVPCFCLLRADGTCAARMTRFTFPKTPYVADRVWFDNYLKRFDEMLTLAADTSEVENDSAGEGSVLLSSNGGEAQATLSAADLRDTYRLAGLTGNAIQKVAVWSADGNLNPEAQVTVSYWRVVDGVAQAVADATASGKLSEIVTKELTATDVGEYFVQVKARHVGPETLDAAFNPTNGVAQNFTTYGIKASIVAYVPGDGRANGISDDNGQVVVRLTKDVLYRFEGLDLNDSSCSDALQPIDETIPHNYFISLVNGDTKLAVLGGAKQVFAYQLWYPGTIGFEKTEMTVEESVNDLNDDWLDLALKRSGGASGAVKVRVSVDAEATTLVDYRGEPRYELLDAEEGNAFADYVWEDGVATNLACRVRVLDEEGYDGDGDLVLNIEVLASTAGGVTVTEGKAVFTLTVTEDDKAEPGRAMVTHVDPFWAKKQTVYARESEGAKIWAARIEASDGLAGVEVKSSLSDVAFATENPRDLEEVYNEKTRKTQTVLWWSNREKSEKYLWVTNVPAGKSAKITLNNRDNFKVVSGSNTVTVVSVADDAPAFGEDTVSKTLYRYVAFSNAYKVTSWQGGKLTFTKLSGTLPTGLKVAFDAETGAMAVSGVPTASDTKTGVKRFESYYQVTEERLVAGRKTKVAGLPICLVYDVVDPTLTGAEGGAPLNAFYAKGCTYTDIPVVTTEGGFLAGTLQLTIPSTGKASGKLLSPLGTISFSSKSFANVNAEGVLTLELASTVKAYPNGVVNVQASNDGSLNIYVGGLSEAYRAVADAPHWTKNASAQAYQGQYTVAMPVRKIDGNPVVVEGIPGLAPRGTPHLTLKMTTATQWNAGKMTWAGMLPDGTAVSGTSVLTEELLPGGKVAYLPIVKQSQKDFFSALPQIQPDAKAQAEAEESENCYQSIKVPTLLVENGSGEPVEVTVMPIWIHTENSKQVEKAGYTVGYNLYGAIFDLSRGLDCCCQTYVGTTNLQLKVVMPTDSDYYGELGPVEAPEVTVTASKVTVRKDSPNPQKLSLTLNSSGVVSGTFKLPYEDELGREKTLTATYKGVVLIGWSSACGCSDVNLPFIHGAWYFTDKLGYETTSGAKTVMKYLNVKRGDVIETVVP